jgi:hypothetical protein
MTLTDDTASSITEALERAAAVHAEVLKRVRDLLQDEEPETSAELDARPTGR